MEFSPHRIDTINIVGVHFKGSQVKISKTRISVPEDCFYLCK